ncbi:DUF1801 domain-containing protein [Flavobacterium jejuense]|uniref:DUF1801 domain-containing protein n=1 Tax=Flavobacterium jejuense TaxID=1544455 RepID=A0ABX0ISJ2_9FLAO|nr:DUF1801 domain-containing protein [Flavobacterium jejuense]NHN26825.1 DUF1801 domain-containing protein [Flavobacterium jejuense]
MTSRATTPEEYIKEVPEERKEAINNLRNVILNNLPEGFKEEMSYGMIGYVIPHEVYPSGYHCNPKLPLPFMSFASQKNSINFYHMGIYANSELYNWFISEYGKFSTKKLDIGKSCMRFKKEQDIPYDLIGELVSKINVNQWISTYENAFKK